MNKQLASSIALWSRLGVAFGALLSMIAVLVLGGSAMSALSGNFYSAASAVLGAIVFTRIAVIFTFACAISQAVFTKLSSDRIDIPSLINLIPALLAFIMNFTLTSSAVIAAILLIMLSMGYLIHTVTPSEAPLTISSIKASFDAVKNMNAARTANAYNPNMNGYNPNMNQGYNPNAGYNPNMNQGYNPNAGYNPNMNQNYNPNMNPGYNPNMNPNPGYNPNVNPNAGYNPNVNPNAGYNPNMNPNPGYNPNANQNYNPNQNNRMQ